MAREVIWSKAALLELDSAARFIAQDSHRYAVTLVAEAEHAALSLTNLSYRGRIVPEIGDPAVRELFIRSYRLIYSVQETRIGIMAFIHSARDLRTLFN